MHMRKPLFSYILLIVFALSFCSYILLYIFVFSKPAVASETDLINCLYGRVIYDSSFSSNGNLVLNVFVNRATNTFGNTVDARGLVTAICKQNCIITSGESICLYGKFSDDLFICSDFVVTDKSFVCHIRQFLIQLFEKRLLGSSNNVSDYLSTALLLGRAEDSSLSIKSLAQSCGCIHILALSGMHLNVLAVLCKKLFGDGKLGKALSSVFVTFFVFVAGPRPSLVRALLMFYYSFLKPKQRLMASFITQLALFPLTMINIGAIYGYVSVFALIFIAPYINELIQPNCGVLTSYAVTLFVAPLSVFLNGQWYWITVFISPLCSVLITMSMVLGLLTLAFGNFSWLCFLKDYVYHILEVLLTYFSRFKPCPLRLLPLLYVPLAVAIVIRIRAKHVYLRKKCSKISSIHTQNKAREVENDIT